MEGNKSAMYEQAGRNRGWTQGFREETTVKVKTVAPAATVPAGIPEVPVIISVPEIMAVPVMPAVPATPMVPVMPAVPVIPEPPVVKMPEMEKMEQCDEACQTLAMAYTAMQKWQDIYDPEKGISRGTIFAELDLPFVGEGACRHE